MLSKCYIVQLYDFKFWQLEGADPIYTVNTLETVKTSKASVPAQSSRKFNGESEMSEIFRIVCIMCPNTSKPGQLNQVTNQFITDCSQRRKKTTATRHFGTLHNALQCFTQRKIRNKPSSNPFKLQAPSDPEVFSRSLAAAAAEALTMGRFGFLMPSSTSLWRQLWAYSRRSSSASAQKKSETKQQQRGRLLLTLSALCAEIAWVQIL